MARRILSSSAIRTGGPSAVEERDATTRERWLAKLAELGRRGD